MNKLSQGGEAKALMSDNYCDINRAEAFIQSVRRRRRGYEIEDATLVEMAALLDSLSRKYKNELEQRIEDCRLLQSSIQVAELNQSYLRAETEVVKNHIGKLFALYRQSSGELKTIRKWVRKLYPGWNRVFDEASRQAARATNTHSNS